MLAASTKKQDLQTSTIRMKLSELYEQLHFNEIYLHDISPRNATELAFSPDALSKKMKRLRLRPSPPTPGERNLRLHWQQNSAACNELMRSHRKAVSAPTVTRSQSRNVKNPSLKLNFNNSSQDRASKRPSTTHKTSAFRASSKESQNTTSKSCTFYPQSTNAFGRSKTFVDLFRPSLQSQTRIKIPQTPLNSPDAGVKVVRVTTKWREPQPESPISNKDSLNETKQLDAQLPKNCDKNPAGLEQNSDSTMSSTCAKQSLTFLHKKASKRTEQNAMTINLSRQLLDMRKRADTSFSKVDWMKIKSLHKTVESTSKSPLLRKSSDVSQKNKNFQDVWQPNSSIQPRSHHIQSQKEKAVTTKNILQIGLPENRFIRASPPRHKTSHKYSSKINTYNIASKKQYRRSKQASQRDIFQQEKKVNSEENLAKYCSISLLNEKQLVVPNPSLVDFGKRNVHTGPENESQANNIYDSNQDPAMMLRILSWLEKVESNSELYYGFDAEKL